MADMDDKVPFGAAAMGADKAVSYQPSIDSAVPETNEEAEQAGPDKQALFWQKQITTAIRQERRWRSEAEHAETAYFGPDEDPQSKQGPDGKASNPISNTTSTIHGNIDVLKPLLFSETPTPIVQRRYRGDGKATDETDLMATEVGQRIAQYLLTTTQFDEAMEGVRDDWLIAGRGAARIFYKAKIESVMDDLTGAMVEKKVDETVYARHWEWRRLLLAPGHGWYNMPWLAFEVPMTRSKAIRAFGEEKASQISYNKKGLIDLSRAPSDSDRSFGTALTDDDTSGELTNNPFDTCTVWEIWIKDDRKIIWWSPDAKDQILDEAEDALNLEEFWPMPKPVTATTKGTSLNPRPDMRYYEAAAEEVETATTKMKQILNVIALAGIYAGSAEEEVKKLLSGKNAVYPAQAFQALMDKGGTRGLIEWLPLDAMIQALNALGQMREQAKQRMFEDSGVSDIMRAQGDPRESATAQNLKGKYAGMRLSSRQRRMAIYVRDMLRLMVEVAVEMFDTEFLADICGLDIPMTEAERQGVIDQRAALEAAHAEAVAAFEEMAQQRQMIEQAAAQQGGQLTLPPMPEPPPPLPPAPRVPKTSWELVHARLRNDLTRKITITIETQSTIIEDEQGDKEARVEFIGAFSSFVQQIIPLVGTGQFDMKTAKELLMFGVRAFPKSRTLEGMISDLPDEMPEGDKAPDVAVQVAQIRAEVDIQIEKMRSADKEAERAHEMRMKGADLAAQAAEQANQQQSGAVPNG